MAIMLRGRSVSQISKELHKNQAKAQHIKYLHRQPLINLPAFCGIDRYKLNNLYSVAFLEHCLFLGGIFAKQLTVMEQ